MDSGEIQKTTVAETPVEYRLGRKMIIFSPGFGVREGSPGMQLFREIITILPLNIGYVLFSYTDEDDGKVLVKSVEEDAARLLNVIAWLRQQQVVEGIAIIAHSRGCIDAAIADLYPLDSMVMLDPPMSSNHARRYFTSKPGAVKRGDDWFVPRSGGSTSIISEQVFDEWETLDLDELILNYALHQPIRVVFAGTDALLGEQDFSRLLSAPNIRVVTISGAGHDFEGPERAVLLKKISDYISKDLLDA